MVGFECAKAEFLTNITQSNHQFASTLAFIERWYQISPSAYRNGPLSSTRNENQGSCQILALAQLWSLSLEQVLLCFAEHYRSVQQDPTGSGHANLRRLMRDGLTDIEFEHFPLTNKESQ